MSEEKSGSVEKKFSAEESAKVKDKHQGLLSEESAKAGDEQHGLSAKDTAKVGDRRLRKWEKEKELIPVMIKKYCKGKHKSKCGELCDDCKALTEYALFRLEKCPFKVDKGFCSFCRIHCYKPEYRREIKEVMKYSGPRMIFTHPIFAMSHVVQMIKYKRQQRQEGR
jgi:hypothetical protein